MIPVSYIYILAKECLTQLAFLIPRDMYLDMKALEATVAISSKEELLRRDVVFRILLTLEKDLKKDAVRLALDFLRPALSPWAYLMIFIWL